MIAESRAGVYQEAFRIALGITAATFFWKATHLPHGSWLLLTISVLYIGLHQGHVLQRANHRILGTALGFLLAYFFVNTLMYQNYHWGYSFPFLYIIMFYLYMVTGNYVIFVTILTCYIGIYYAIIEGPRIDYFLFGTLFNRFYCTLLGIVFVLLLEFTVFPRAKRTSHLFERNLSSLFLDFSENVPLLCRHYVHRSAITNQEWRLVSRIVEKHTSARSLSHLMGYELNLDRHYQEFCSLHVVQIDELLESLRRLICLARHPRPALLHPTSRQNIGEAGTIISQGFAGLAEMHDDRDAPPWIPLTPRVLSLFPQGEIRLSLIIQELIRFAEVLDHLAEEMLNPT